MPLVYFFGFVVFASQYNLNGGVIARFSQLVILSGIAGTAWNAFFNVVPSQKRGQVLAFQNGVPSQIGVALSGLLLILGERVLTTSQILLLGLGFTLVCGFLVWRMRAAYGQSLLAALRAGRLEVFSSEETAFAGLIGDAAALKVVTQRYRMPNRPCGASRRKFSQRCKIRAAIPALTPLYPGPEPAVRAAVIRALGALHAHASHRPGPGMPGRPAGRSPQGCDQRPDPIKPSAIPTGLEKKLTEFLNDRSYAVRAQAAVALGRWGRTAQALPVLMDWLASSDQSCAYCRARGSVAGIGLFRARLQTWFTFKRPSRPIRIRPAGRLPRLHSSDRPGGSRSAGGVSIGYR